MLVQKRTLLVLMAMLVVFFMAPLSISKAHADTALTANAGTTDP